MDKNSFNSCESIERVSTINILCLTFQEMYVKLEGNKFFTLEIEYFFSLFHVQVNAELMVVSKQS